MKKGGFNINQDQRKAIQEFFKSTLKLKETGVIRSSQYVGNVAEFICSHLYGVKLSKSQREEGLDGIDKKGRKVEIKYHGAPVGTNIVMSKYKERHDFQDLIVILGPDSNLRPKDTQDNTFLVYRIDEYVYNKHGNIAKSILEQVGVDKVLDDQLNLINNLRDSRK